jgi:hypothetical protein
MIKQASASFLKKRSKKLSVLWATGHENGTVPFSESFLRAFFQKSAACLLAFSRVPA